MIQKNRLPNQLFHPVSLGKPIGAGAGIALLVISFFVFGVDEPQPEWGKFWMIRPLLIVPLAGATGGFCYYLLVYFHQKIGINKPVAVLLSVLIFIVSLWLGIVLGLDGTLWN